MFIEISKYNFRISIFPNFSGFSSYKKSNKNMSVQHKKSLIQHTHQLNTKNHSNTNRQKIAFVLNWRVWLSSAVELELFVLKRRFLCVEPTCVLNWRIERTIFVG